MTKVKVYERITKGENIGHWASIGYITLHNENYTEATSFLEFERKAKLVPRSNYSDFGFNKKAFANLWYSENNDKLYTIETTK